jgi:hypothetical protein
MIFVNCSLTIFNLWWFRNFILKILWLSNSVNSPIFSQQTMHCMKMKKLEMFLEMRKTFGWKQSRPQKEKARQRSKPDVFIASSETSVSIKSPQSKNIAGHKIFPLWGMLGKMGVRLSMLKYCVVRFMKIRRFSILDSKRSRWFFSESLEWGLFLEFERARSDDS